MLHEKLLTIIRPATTMDPHKIPTSPALQRLGEEFQAMYGQQLEARGEAGALLKFLAARGFVVPEAWRARVVACDDVATLDRWITRAARAATLDEVFAD
jgi:hypothetical protein